MSFNERLQELQRELSERQLLTSQLERATLRVSEQQDKVKVLWEKAKKEKEDVDKLEGMSITGLFAKLSGNHDEKLSKEKREYLEAQMLLMEAENYLNQLKDSKERIDKELNLLFDVEDEYNRLIEEKKQSLMNENNESAKKLVELVKKSLELQSELKEVEEAINAGNNVFVDISELESQLKSIKNIGTYDMFFGSTFSSFHKHGKIDEAVHLLNKLKLKLNNFNKELLDVDKDAQTISMELNMSGTTKMFDICFDNIFTDMHVQNKITAALDDTVSLRSRMNKYISGLEKLGTEIGEKIKNVKNEIDEIVVNR
ncbi:MAG: hypothetical protein RR486_08240 [Clostridium sp.]|uniref:hypothetical protein n=1 Tax=Clostridium sp. TaxID=1506 RepID=UPI00304081E8